MTKTPWAHLPNAKHIDAVLASVKARPGAWRAARDAAFTAAWDAAFTASRGTARDAIWGAPFTAATAAQDVPFTAAQHAAWGAILALIAWDSSAELLGLPPDVLRTMADLAPEPVCHQAALLLPYAIVREGV